MKLYNTLSGTVDSFSAADGKVKMYVCGVTPYAPSHIGHAMCSVIFDVVRRYLEFKGYDVEHIQNFTDIDDKMIRAAAEMDISTEELAETNIQAYMEELESLNILPAHVYPRATQEIPSIVEMIKTLVQRGFAYSVDDGVYFRVKSNEGYGKLSHRSLDGLLAGARVEIDESKEDPMDFALWKSQKPGEPSWDSPWGPGRPGWHIECSAMSVSYLGETIDIHGGGQDLIFPHHENEIAQTESCTDKVPFARFWIHNGLLRLGDDKMSKSLGNIISVREALEKSTPDALRLFFLSAHYRGPLVYSDQAISSHERAAERLRNALRTDGTAAIGQSLDPSSYSDRFVEAMDDDLNTPRALAALFDLGRDINRGREEGSDVTRAQDVLKELALVLGITLEEPRSGSEDMDRFVELLIEIRSDLRAAKQYDLGDKIRLKLADLGVTLEDTADGTAWRRRPI